MCHLTLAPPVPYFGGKSAGIYAPRHTARWIVSNLPTDAVGYVETHGGILGILLARPRARHETVNDLNGRVVNFWKVVKDDCASLVHEVLHTPRSEEIYKAAIASLDEGTALERAVKFIVAVRNSWMHVDAPSSFAHRLDSYEIPTCEVARRIEGMARRLRDVQLLNRPAIEVLDEAQTKDDILVYIDPPYRGSSSPYPVQQEDYEETLRLLRLQAGRVAISGMGNDWDELGWKRRELSRPSNPVASEAGASRRIEVLWTNYTLQGTLI